MYRRCGQVQARRIVDLAQVQPTRLDRATRDRRCERGGVSLSRSRTNLAGTPATRVSGATSWVTTAPAATTAPLPTATPGRIVTPDASHTPSPTSIAPATGRPDRLPDRPSS